MSTRATALPISADNVSREFGTQALNSRDTGNMSAFYAEAGLPRAVHHAYIGRCVTAAKRYN